MLCELDHSVVSPSILVSLIFCVDTGPFVVGFMETAYRVSEGDGQVKVCIALISPEGDIGGKRVLVEVFNHANPETIAAGTPAASKLIHLC